MDSVVDPDDLRNFEQDALHPPWGDWGRSATLGAVSLLSKLVLRVLNTTSVQGLEEFQWHVMQRPPGVGLVTVSNHTSTVDDPMLLSAMLPWGYFLTEHLHRGMRWSLCAREMCYPNKLLGQFFQSGKTLPIERGAGLRQPIMHVVAHEVARGGWVHIFPEGRVTYTGTLGPLRWGVGKVVCDATRLAGGAPPLLLPFYHSGMGRVLPRGGRLPRAGQQVAVAVGAPVPLGDLACRCGSAEEDQQQVAS